MFMVSSSVTRMPWMNRDSFPSFFRTAPICGPPPWTTTGLIPMYFIMTMSMAKSLLSSSSTMAWPPYFTTIVLL